MVHSSGARETEPMPRESWEVEHGSWTGKRAQWDSLEHWLLFEESMEPLSPARWRHEEWMHPASRYLGLSGEPTWRCFSYWLCPSNRPAAVSEPGCPRGGPWSSTALAWSQCGLTCSWAHGFSAAQLSSMLGDHRAHRPNSSCKCPTELANKTKTVKGNERNTESCSLPCSLKNLAAVGDSVPCAAPTPGLWMPGVQGTFTSLLFASDQRVESLLSICARSLKGMQLGCEWNPTMSVKMTTTWIPLIRGT